MAVSLVKEPMREYTVVLDWDSSDLGGVDAPVVQVRAVNRLSAMYAAREAAWHHWAGHIDEIPADAEYEEWTAEDLWYTVAILDGHAFEAVA